MKKKLILLLVSVMCLTSGCNTAARKWGGSITVSLEPNQKLELVTWKDDSLWYLTRPMRENETPETYTYQQDTTWGVFEGTVTIIESK